MCPSRTNVSGKQKRGAEAPLFRLRIGLIAERVCRKCIVAIEHDRQINRAGRGSRSGHTENYVTQAVRILEVTYRDYVATEGRWIPCSNSKRVIQEEGI